MNNGLGMRVEISFSVHKKYSTAIKISKCVKYFIAGRWWRPPGV
jgi:hypothetical protein